jgi:hypothetical protein
MKTFKANEKVQKVFTQYLESTEVKKPTLALYSTELFDCIQSSNFENMSDKLKQDIETNIKFITEFSK